MHILAATDFSTRALKGLQRAGLLAQARGAELTLVHAVDDDRPQEFVAVVRREAERILRDQIGAMRELQGVGAQALVVDGAPFDGILRAAASTGTNLVVMGVPRRQLLRDVLFGTTIERVIRKGSLPVLMVSREPDQPYRTALAALDMSAPSLHAIRIGREIGLPGGDRCAVVHAFEARGRGKMVMAGISQVAVEEYVAAERERAERQLIAFLDANGFGDGQVMMSVEEGAPFEVISRAVERAKPDVLIMGTHDRSGVSRALLGSVAEQVLRSLDVDILAVPPAR